jgi:hypothetical protein
MMLMATFAAMNALLVIHTVTVRCSDRLNYKIRMLISLSLFSRTPRNAFEMSEKHQSPYENMLGVNSLSEPCPHKKSTA